MSSAHCYFDFCYDSIKNEICIISNRSFIIVDYCERLKISLAQWTYLK